MILLDAVAVESQVSQHGGEQAGPDFLSAIGDDCLAGAVIQSGVSALAAAVVKPHGHAALTSDLGDPLYEFPLRPEYIIVKKNDIRYQLTQYRVSFWIDPASSFCVTIEL